MKPTISLEVRTSYGEDLYVYPYSYKHTSNKLFFYPATQFTVKDTQQYLREIEEISKTKKTIVKYFNCFKEWLEVFSWQFEDFFGRAVFDECFKYREWSLDLYWLMDNLKYSHVFTAESVFKDIVLKGQLYLSEHKYIDNIYLTPTKEYFDERLEEWINEDVAAIYANDTYTTEEDKQELIQFYSQLRQDYKNWRDTEMAKGNRIEYLYSLNI